ncbi:hypothetical protein T11_5929 [Trichinella zimbabwensis]|uniref:Uncharacterized protein n=1 Tax=Trichinella zimbabwensis TaxID=268475 RepID=A0A0V1GYA9_9BILA|nr:hypothetical protein T11_15961 [Trichinella zimbabwensis]KRZ03352.1 hypothetical protein T11_5929 [Trichinella zimbabwensis]
MFLVQLEKRRSWMIEPPPWTRCDADPRAITTDARLGYLCLMAQEGASIQAPGRQRNWRQDKGDQNRPLERAEQSRLVKDARRRLRASVLDWVCCVVVFNKRYAFYTEYVETSEGIARRRRRFDGQRRRPGKTRQPLSRGTGRLRRRAA